MKADRIFVPFEYSVVFSCMFRYIVKHYNRCLFLEPRFGNDARCIHIKREFQYYIFFHSALSEPAGILIVEGNNDCLEVETFIATVNVD
jgi:hypothetical protein